MESRASVLEKAKKVWNALDEVDEIWRSDREVVLAAVNVNGMALKYAAEALKGDREIVLAAVQGNGYAIEHAADSLKADRDVVLAAVRQNGDALQSAAEALKIDREVVLAAVQNRAADCFLEDPTFATEAKRRFRLLKLTMLSGRSTVVAADDEDEVEDVLDTASERLGLPEDGSTIELWHGSGEKVPDDDRSTEVHNWPGVQPTGEISEYQLLLRR